MNKINKEHSYWIDFLRIFGCACVVILHVIAPHVTNVELYGTRTWYITVVLTGFVRTGVPIFLMISGYLLLKNPLNANVSEFYKKRFGKILIPFMIWNIVYFIYVRISEHIQINLIDFIKELFTNGSSYQFWYVYTLSAIYLITPFLRMIIEKTSTKQQLALVFLIIFTWTIRPFLNTYLPFNIYLFEPIAEGYLGYFILGYILANEYFSLKYRVLIYTGGIIGFLYGLWRNLSDSSHEAINLKGIGPYEINQFLCAAAIFTLFKYAFEKIKIKQSIGRLLTTISGLTYGVYLTHVLALNILNKLEFLNSLSPANEIIVFFIFAFFIPVLILYLISKIKYIGKYFM